MAETPHDIPEEIEETLGALFRNARHTQHISVQDVVESTRIHARFIRDLEEDNYAKMPAEIFVRGFIKLYAEFLGIDPDQAIRIYVQQVNADPKDSADKQYGRNILVGKNYAYPPVYTKNKKKLAVILITLTLLVTFIIIASLLPEISKRLNSVDQEYGITVLQNGTVVDPDVENDTSHLSDGTQIIVDRPPPITINETSAPALSLDVKSSETKESARILDPRVYKATNQNDQPEILPADDSLIEQEVTRTPEHLTPEPMEEIPFTADQEIPSEIFTESTDISEGEHAVFKPVVMEGEEIDSLKIENSVITLPADGHGSNSETILVTPSSEPADQTVDEPAQPEIIDKVHPGSVEMINPASESSSAEPFESKTPVIPETTSPETADEKSVPTYRHFQPVTVTVPTTKTLPETDSEPKIETPPQNSQAAEEDTP